MAGVGRRRRGERARRRGHDLLRRLDDIQRCHGMLGHPHAVLRKYLDDEGAKLAALMTYYGFLSVFPILLFAVAVLTEILTAHPSLQERLIEELVAPRLRPDVERALEQLPPTGIPLLIAAIGLLLSGTGGVLAGYTALNRIWAVSYRERFGIARRYARVLSCCSWCSSAPSPQQVTVCSSPRRPGSP